ncbi:hypothetical protein [Halolamina sp. C58]|uniref:hypothetical protein n=1 Tax=Halolamina sp. C58 TaxID=3421640 RepID=UPI003EBD2EE4
MVLTDIRVVDSVTQLAADAAPSVVVAASHGGAYAGYLAARAGVRGVILNDAGVGKEAAGVATLPAFDEHGTPAATVHHDSARIGDGADTVRSGQLSRVNDAAAALGCAVGDSTLDAAERMRDADPAPSPEPRSPGRFELDDGDPAVWGMDSLSLIRPEDDGRIAITASHGARLAGERESYIAGDVAGAVFNDAGGGKEGAGRSRLPFLDERGIPAATVAHDSARIGDARSTWTDGVVSAVNDAAAARGGSVGMDCRAFVAALQETID